MKFFETWFLLCGEEKKWRRFNFLELLFLLSFFLNHSGTQQGNRRSTLYVFNIVIEINWLGILVVYLTRNLVPASTRRCLAQYIYYTYTILEHGKKQSYVEQK